MTVRKLRSLLKERIFDVNNFATYLLHKSKKERVSYDKRTPFYYPGSLEPVLILLLLLPVIESERLSGRLSSFGEVT